jgi:hypothetical protein
MSAVLTKKPGGDYATQLTFPAVFAAQAKASNLASQFYPDAQSRPMVIPRGSGLQEDYHEQKRLDANRRCLNGVRDNAASTARYLNSHANYIVPRPVLSQRKYANPSNGNQADIYSSRPIQWNTMSGGVRTAEGQKWAIGKLKERVPQLDAIKAAKEAFVMGVPMGAMGAEAVGISDITAKVELYGLLTRVESEVEQGVVNNKTVEKSQSLLKLMFSFVPYGEIREVEEVMESVEYIKKSLDGIVEQGEEGVAEQSKAGEAVMRNATYLSGLYEKMYQYLTRMNGVLNRPRKEREKASSVFIKSLGFSELEKKLLPDMSARVRREVAAAEAANPNADPDGEEAEEAAVVDDDGKYDDDDDDDEAGAPPPPGPYATSSSLSSFGPSASSSSSAFGPPTPPRSPRGKNASEPGLGSFDRLAFAEAMGYRDAPDEEREPEFDEDEREEFGKRSGAFLGEAAPAEAAVRSTGSESAEMMVLPEETEESIARRSGLLPAEAAASEAVNPNIAVPQPRVLQRKPLIADLTDEQRADYDRGKILLRDPKYYPAELQTAVETGALDRDSFKAPNIDATAQLIKQMGLTKSSKTGSALRGYIKQQFEAKTLRLIQLKAYEFQAAAALRSRERRDALEAQKKKSSP